MNKQIIFNQEAKDKLLIGIEKLSKAVCCTLGPSGRNVIIEKEHGQISSTKDGVTVAKSIFLSDVIENMGAQMVKQAAIKTGEIAGDGTTTATLLAYELIINGVKSIKAGSNAVEVRKGMDKACKLVIEELKKISKPINDEKQIKQVATISANNDEEIGNLVATAMEKVGRDGIVSVEESRTGETYLESVEGMQFTRGYKSPHFVTNQNNMQTVLTDVSVLIYDKKITQAKDLLAILNHISSNSKSLLIIAEDIEGEALATLIVNKIRGTIKVVAVKAPDFGDRRNQILEDIAILTGAQVVSSEKGMKLETPSTDWLGQARVVTVTKDDTTIVDGKGNEEKLKERVLALKEQIDASDSDFEIERLQDRLAKLIGGVAIINVGGANEIDIKEKKDRVDDALQSTKASLEQGILPGGGIALLRASAVLGNKKFLNSLNEDENLGVDLVYESLNKPFYQILKNAGYSEDNIYNLYYKILSKKDVWVGFNPKIGKIVNMFDDGILDPTKVTRTALENAVSVAGTMLITEAVIGKEKEDKKDEEPDYSNFGM